MPRKKKNSSIVHDGSFDKPAKEIIDISLTDEIKTSYSEYAFSVIYARAIPDIRDGLQPVQRRILYSMGVHKHSSSLPYSKSAKIVGEVMGEFHPHGDCLGADTYILDTLGNLHSIKSLYDRGVKELEVYALGDDDVIYKTIAHDFRIGQYADTKFKITFQNGIVIEATGNHPFSLGGGKWIKAEDITIGSVVSSAQRNFQEPYLLNTFSTVINVEEIATDHEPMYDFTVDTYHNLFVGNIVSPDEINLVCVHNSAIYKSMVLMAKNFSTNVPLVDPHGNFGSDSDGPAASRYTEARLSKAGEALLGEINEETVEFIPNFDSSTVEPRVLPNTWPNLPINGVNGIAVGVTSFIPPHNPTEVIDATKWLVTHPNMTTEKLVEIMPGPDFPEGGTIVNPENMKEIYETGVGKIIVRGTYHVEPLKSGKHRIVFTTIPYNVSAEDVINKIKSGVQDKRIIGVATANDLTDRRNGRYLVVDVKAGFNPLTVIKTIYKYTPLETSYSMYFRALKDGKLQLVSMKDMLQAFIEHRKSIIVKRSEFSLKKQMSRKHLIEGLILVLADIDKAIRIIRNADNSETAKKKLQTAFKIDPEQADYILSLQLRRLTKFDTLALKQEKKDLDDSIDNLQKLIKSDQLIRKTIVQELESVKKLIGHERRTLIANAPLKEDVIPDDIPEVDEKTGEVLDFPEATVYLTSKGRLVTKHVGDVISELTYKGTFLALDKKGDVHRVRSGDQYPNIIAIAPDEKKGYLVMGTKEGIVKVANPDYLTTQDDFSIFTLEKSDEIVGAKWVESLEDTYVAFISSDSSLLYFSASNVRPHGRTSSGMSGINLVDDNKVVAVGIVDKKDVDDKSALVFTYSGVSGKLTPLGEYPTKGRSSKGVRSQRFLKGEDHLELAGVGKGLVLINGTKQVKLDINPKRDASGEKTDITTVYSKLSNK